MSSSGKNHLTDPSRDQERASALSDELCSMCSDRTTLDNLRAEGLRRIRAEDEVTRGACTAQMRAEGRFDLLAACFQQALHRDPFHQSEHFERGVSTQTAVRLEDQDTDDVLEAMVGMKWSRWWRGGRVVKWRRTESGTDFYLWPVWLRVPIRVHISIEPPREELEQVGGLKRRKLVLPARFSGCFEGPALFEIVTLPDGCVLRAAWQNIFPRGWVKILSYERMARNHLAAERGEMDGAPGGGYLGLRHFLGLS